MMLMAEFLASIFRESIGCVDTQKRMPRELSELAGHVKSVRSSFRTQSLSRSDWTIPAAAIESSGRCYSPDYSACDDTDDTDSDRSGRAGANTACGAHLPSVKVQQSASDGAFMTRVTVFALGRSLEVTDLHGAVLDLEFRPVKAIFVLVVLLSVFAIGRKFGASNRSDCGGRVNLKGRGAAAHRADNHRMKLTAQQSNLARRADTIYEHAFIDRDCAVRTELERAVVDQPDGQGGGRLGGNFVVQHHRQSRRGDKVERSALNIRDALDLCDGADRCLRSGRRNDRGNHERHHGDHDRGKGISHIACPRYVLAHLFKSQFGLCAAAVLHIATFVENGSLQRQ